jgi:hypothetical protein
MTQAIDIIRDALEHLRVADANSALDVNDTATGLKALNAMMRAWEADGISLGWSDVAAATDAVPTPPEADEAIGANLAIRLAAKYGKQPDGSVVAIATNGVSMLHAMVYGNDYARCRYDDLPAGVGGCGNAARWFT